MEASGIEPQSSDEHRRAGRRNSAISVARLIGETARQRLRAPLPQAWTLPPAAYTDPRVFAAEAETIFTREWLCVAREDQLSEVGDYVCVDVLDQPVVVTRATDGALHALSRVCLHRAMPLAEGAGNAARFVCPYHNWTYELDGRLRSAPLMKGAEDFTAGACRLPALPLTTWQGFVFVSRDPTAALAPRLQGLTRLLEGTGLDALTVAATVEYDSPWNWKLLVENFMEAYHHIGTHRSTLQPTYPAARSLVEDNGGEPWALLRMPGGGSELTAICVLPSLLFALLPGGGGLWYQLEPAAYDRLRLRIHVLTVPGAGPRGADERAAMLEAVRAVHEEDIGANQGPWRGLKAPLTAQGRLSPFEKAIWQLNQLWADGIGLR